MRRNQFKPKTSSASNTIDNYLNKTSNTRARGYDTSRGISPTRSRNSRTTSPRFNRDRRVTEQVNSQRSVGHKKEKDSFDGFKDELRKLTGAVTKLIGIDTRVERTEAAVNGISVKMNQLDQQFLNCKMDIEGLQIDDDSDARISVIDYINGLGINVLSSELLDAYTWTRKRHNGSYLVVRAIFSHEVVKVRIMREKILKDRESEAAPQVYFNHVLTRTNNQIFHRGRHLKKQGVIKDIKFHSGRLFVFPIDSTDKILIQSMSDLESLSEFVQDDADMSFESTNSQIPIGEVQQPNHGQQLNHGHQSSGKSGKKGGVKAAKVTKQDKKPLNQRNKPLTSGKGVPKNQHDKNERSRSGSVESSQ